MAETPDPKRLQELDARLRAARKTQEPAPRRNYTNAVAGYGWRMVIELVTGMAFGFGIGYGLDWLLGTLPLFLVVFCLLGFAAGVRVMMQTAAEMRREAEKLPTSGLPPSVPDDDDD